jgi:two-component system cell cycle sensor histidine kinase/response regulator CckA
MSPEYSRSRRTILVVDDDSSVVEALSKVLSKHGYEVLTATGGDQAGEVVRTHAGSIDLLIVDAVMPKVSGPELAERLLQLRPAMKVLFITGLDGLAIQLAFGRPCESVQKPFTVRFLVTKVQETLGDARTGGPVSPPVLL